MKDKKLLNNLLVYLFAILLLSSCTKKDTTSNLYIVKSGDYLGKIAKKLNVRVIDIKEWNKLGTDEIKIGQKLNIYYPTNKIDSLKFGITQRELEGILGIPPRIKQFEQLVQLELSGHPSINDSIKYLTYNIDSDNIGIINNKSIEGLEYDEIETVSFGFIDDSLSLISYDYREIEFKKYFNYLTRKGFVFKERAPLYWDGKGILYKEEVFVDLAYMVENGNIFCTFFRKSPEVLKMFNIKEEK